MSKSPYFVSWTQVLISFIVSLILTFGFVLLLWPPLNAAKPMSESLTNMKELHFAIQQMTQDGDWNAQSIQWTCQNNEPVTRDRLRAALAEGNYLSTVNFDLAISAKTPARFVSRTIPDSVTIYAVTLSDPDNTLLLSSKNWHGPDSPLSGEPFGDLGYVNFFKSGEGHVIRADSSGTRASIGQGGKYNYQALK